MHFISNSLYARINKIRLKSATVKGHEADEREHGLNGLQAEDDAAQHHLDPQDERLPDEEEKDAENAGHEHQHGRQGRRGALRQVSLASEVVPQCFARAQREQQKYLDRQIRRRKWKN